MKITFRLLVLGMAVGAVACAEDEARTDSDTSTAAASAYELPSHSPHVQVRRFDENPIIRPEMLPEGDGNNINGPSLIRVPGWLPNPLGKYYLYFAHHNGTYIRLAYADSVAGPWTVYTPGTLQLDQAPDGRRHIASPDVLVDDEHKELRMYFHCPSKSVDAQMSYLARSTDGIHFVADSVPLGPSYFRVFRRGEYWYAMAKPGTLYRSKDGAAPFEAGPNPLTGLPGCNDGVRRIRHVALDVKSDTMDVYWTSIGDRPESILRATIDLRPDWTQWRASVPELVLKPETLYEGADLPELPSKEGKVMERVRAVRDPGIFKEEGRTYLLYSVAGEAGIAIAELLAR